jgi:hypothetical protein
MLSPYPPQCGGGALGESGIQGNDTQHFQMGNGFPLKTAGMTPQRNPS